MPGKLPMSMRRMEHFLAQLDLPATSTDAIFASTRARIKLGILSAAGVLAGPRMRWVDGMRCSRIVCRKFMNW